MTVQEIEDHLILHKMKKRINNYTVYSIMASRKHRLTINNDNYTIQHIYKIDGLPLTSNYLPIVYLNTDIN